MPWGGLVIRVRRTCRLSAGPVLWMGVMAVGAFLPGSIDAMAEDVPPPESSELARLAEHSLLLDAASANGRLVAVGDRGHVLVSTDDAATWTQVVVPARSMLNAVVLLEDGHGWAVGHDAVILHTRDGGESWELQHWAPELEQPLFDVWFADARRGIAIGAYGLYMETQDGGAHWAQRTVDDEEPHLYQLAPSTSGVLHMAGEFGSIYRSDDAGVTWIKSESPYEGSFFGALAVGADGVLVFGLRGNLFRSDDGGVTWSEVSSGTRTGLFDALHLPNGKVVVAGQSGMVCVSEDGGRSFTAHNLGTRDSISSILSLDRNRVLLVGESGVTALDSLAGTAPGGLEDAP